MMDEEEKIASPPTVYINPNVFYCALSLYSLYSGRPIGLGGGEAGYATALLDPRLQFKGVKDQQLFLDMLFKSYKRKSHISKK